MKTGSRQPRRRFKPAEAPTAAQSDAAAALAITDSRPPGSAVLWGKFLRQSICRNESEFFQTESFSEKPQVSTVLFSSCPFIMRMSFLAAQAPKFSSLGDPVR